MARPFKKTFADAAHVVLIDETGLLLNPLVRRTWAPKGKTPVLESRGGHRKKVSVIGAVTLSPISRRLGFYFATQVDGYFDTGKVVDFLRDLLKHLRGRVVVVWDGGPNHKGPAMREFLRRNRRRVDARPHLRAALEVFADLGAEPWAERARQELRASGETARKRDVTTTGNLTPQERQTALLVGAGLGNRDIAARLFLSPRTVEYHLSNAYQKLGVRSRGELAQLRLS